jgi:PRTRC genetic system protein E
MFVELLPILRNRPVMLTVALVGDNAIRVNVIPKRIKNSDPGDDALTTPLTVTGSPDVLDREFAAQVVGFTDAFVKLGSNLTEIEAAHVTAVKAVEAEKKKELDNKRKGSISKPSSTTTEAKPGPVVKDGKPVFGTKAGSLETPSLFDSHETAASGASQQQPVASSTGQVVSAPPEEITESLDKPITEVETGATRLPGL